MVSSAEVASYSISANLGSGFPMITGVSFTSSTVIATPRASWSRGDPLSRTLTVTS